MELEFDKEMDAMLRKAGRSGVLVGDSAKLHLDADAINAFAENALPEKSRRIYTEHLAECDPCRRTLSSLILMNAEAEPEMAAAVPAQATLASIPWHRKLFQAPNLAYTFGGLILLFGGLIGFVTLQNMDSGNATVSQVADTQREYSAPAAAPMTAASNSNAAANAANTSSNAVGEIPRALGTTDLPADDGSSIVSPPPPAPMPMVSAPATGAASNTAGRSITLDGADVTGGAPAPKELAKAKSSDDVSGMRVEEKRAMSEQDARKQDPEINSRTMNQTQIQNQNQFPMPGNTKDYAGPNRNMARDNRAYDSAASAKKAVAPASASRPDAGSTRRSVGGKTFELKQGAWYDTTYSTQPTIRVRRGSDEYKKLDGGLRSIAENIGGLVVVVWKGKAYRIQ
jgi:hypothetical protein